MGEHEKLMVSANLFAHYNEARMSNQRRRASKYNWHHTRGTERHKRERAQECEGARATLKYSIITFDRNR